MNYLTVLVICMLGCVMSSCSSKKKQSAPPTMSRSMSQRLTKPDMGRRSVYDKEMQASFSSRKNTGPWLGKQKYSAKSFGNNKKFTQTPNYKTAEFSGNKENSKLANQTFAQKDKAPSFADQTFSTTESRFDNTKARDATRTFSDANETFKTASNRDALKAQQKNTRPTIIQLEENEKKPAYTEEQVKRLIGRD